MGISSIPFRGQEHSTAVRHPAPFGLDVGLTRCVSFCSFWKAHCHDRRMCVSTTILQQPAPSTKAQLRMVEAIRSTLCPCTTSTEVLPLQLH
eukprot:2592697-Amphidinium_carterae.1